MKTIGKVHVVTDLISGESSNGQPWEKQTVVVEEQTSGRPRYVAVEFMGEKKTAVTKTLQRGDMVDVDYYINCNEYTNPQTGATTWFTKLEGAKLRKMVAEPTPEQ